LTDLNTVLGNVALGEFIVIAGFAVYWWYRKRTAATGWAALALSIVGLVAVTGSAVATVSATGWAESWFPKALVGSLVIMAYCLFCFATSFRRRPALLHVLALALTVAALALTVKVPYVSLHGTTPSTTSLLWFRAAVVVQWCFSFAVAAVSLLWLAGTQHSMAATRMRVLGAVGLCAVGLTVCNSPEFIHHHDVSLAGDFLTVALGTLMLLAVLSFQRSWSTKREVEFRQAISDLMGVESSDQLVGRMLPHVCALVGASSAVLLDQGGEVVAQNDRADVRWNPDQVPPYAVDLTYRLGPEQQVVVRVDRTVSYFGQPELQRLEELLTVVELATEQCDTNASLTFQARHDDLTGLPNREQFVRRVSRALAGLERRSESVAVMSIDLDQFHLVNNRIDHSAGDVALKQIGARLRSVVGEDDTVARMGADQFAVLVAVKDEESALARANELREVIGSPLHIGTRKFSITASIGVVVSQEPSADPWSLLGEAETAMYLAKQAGPDHVQLFDTEIRDLRLQRANLERELLHAIGAGELRLLYQPVFRLADGIAVGTEALVRWQHPTQGLLSPDVFLPLAEEAGLIKQIDDWVLNEACRQAAEWLEILPGKEPFTMWVNKSASEFDRSDVARSVMAVVEYNELAPGNLGVELTETVFISDVARLRTTMCDLNWNGVAIAIDDFGTGYSSLSYLKRFPVDILKIDRSFVQGIGAEPETSLIEASLALAKSLDILTVAEGVESLEHGEWLRAAGCQHVQGFAYCRPLEPEAAVEKLRECRQHTRRGGTFEAYRELTKNAAVHANGSWEATPEKPPARTRARRKPAPAKTPTEN
jgi:diguanylate cyclase (GGDEF)-like protein